MPCRPRQTTPTPETAPRESPWCPTNRSAAGPAGSSTGWLGPLESALGADPNLAAVQGTVTDSTGAAVDGRGIALDETALPIQIDRGASPAPEPDQPRTVIAVSGTASLYRVSALRESTLTDGSILDPRFGSYHEDLDLGLRLRRLGWGALWVPGARASHEGSATGHGLGWRHPWWVLTNRWRALAGNLTAACDTFVDVELEDRAVVINKQIVHAEVGQLEGTG